MRSRIFFAAITGFWLVMNFLLWRSQSAAHSQIGSAIPADIVWDKILTAPDNSSLDIFDHDKKIGFCQWTTTEGSAVQALNQSLAQDYAPDGSTPEPTGYALGVDGNSAIFGTNRLRFDAHLRLATNQTWQDFHINVKMRPYIWDIHAIAATGKIMVKANDDGGGWQHTFNLSDLQHPESLLAEFGVEGPASELLEKESMTQAKAGIHWDAHEDWMQFGHSRVQVYRLETEILGQHLYVFTSRVGEILWVEAPNKLTFRNEAFSHF